MLEAMPDEAPNVLYFGISLCGCMELSTSPKKISTPHQKQTSSVVAVHTFTMSRLLHFVR